MALIYIYNIYLANQILIKKNKSLSVLLIEYVIIPINFPLLCKMKKCTKLSDRKIERQMKHFE